MSKKTIWTPSAKTLVSKAETRFRKKLKTTEDRRKRLQVRHKRLADDIVKVTADLERIKKAGPQLTPEELKAKAKEDAKMTKLVEMHEKKKMSFAQIGKALKISHAWAHSLYIQHKGKAGKKVAKPAAKKAAKPAKKAVKAKPAKKESASPVKPKVAKKVTKVNPVTPISEGAKWGDSAVE